MTNKKLSPLDEAKAQFEKSLTEKKEQPEETATTAAAITMPHERTAAETVELEVAKQRFAKEFSMRSFSGRNPTLGPMINCRMCGRRHRDSEKHSESVKYIKVSEGGRPAANPYGWRTKPGKTMWIEELKKFVTINR